MLAVRRPPGTSWRLIDAPWLLCHRSRRKATGQVKKKGWIDRLYDPQYGLIMTLRSLPSTTCGCLARTDVIRFRHCNMRHAYDLPRAVSDGASTLGDGMIW